MIDFGGVPAQYVRLTIHSNWGDIFTQYGLSEVRFFSIPAAAREPDPAADANEVDPQTALSWRPGREAATHQVYLDTDEQAVTDGTAPFVTVTEPRYDAPLDLLETYYWKVAEVNDAADPAIWESDVWTFSTAAALVVDDFESYTNNSPDRVFQTWIDGVGFSPDEWFPNGNPGNGSGALVGYDPVLGDIMETGIVHGGRQSMPLDYDNNIAPRYSQAERTFAIPQDWSRHAITTLALYFRGLESNVAAPVYATINGKKVFYNDGAPATAFPVWKQWNIDLATLGVSVTNVTTLAIGVGDGAGGGTGRIFVDDIRLYRAPPEVVTPADPGTTGLVALYAMEGNVQDTSGQGNHGTASGDPVYDQGPPGYGQVLNFDGLNDYVDLPIGSLLSSLASVTITTRVSVLDPTRLWQRIFDFGTDTTNYMFLSPNNGITSTVRFAIRTPTVDEQVVTAPTALSEGWHHVAIVLDGATGTMQLYQDGTMVDSSTTTLLPRDMGVTSQNWLGRSQWTDDPYFGGSLDEVRIYNRALSESEVRYLAGDR